MKIILSGGSGLVGSALTDAFRAEGHSVWRLVRLARPRAAHEIFWDPQSAEVDVSALEGADVVVNLNGANLSEGRWTPARKQALRGSRVGSTRVLVDSLGRLRQAPQVFISASAVGYYGNRGDEVLTESSKGGEDFLSVLARDWEAEANRAQQTGIRAAILRFGVILSNKGGALPQIIRPFQFGAGGRLGSGMQWLSWVALEDVIGIVRLVVGNSLLSGAINAVTPCPVRNADFARIVGRVLHRPAIFPAPAFALRFALGEVADALLLSSQRVIPEKLERMNYRFKFQDLEAALRSILGPR